MAVVDAPDVGAAVEAVMVAGAVLATAPELATATSPVATVVVVESLEESESPHATRATLPTNINAKIRCSRRIRHLHRSSTIDRPRHDVS
ncbi:MAG: hypothetical protein AB7V43_15405 [Acidimicrobiia bacterium]